MVVNLVERKERIQREKKSRAIKRILELAKEFNNVPESTDGKQTGRTNKPVRVAREL